MLARLEYTGVQRGAPTVHTLTRPHGVAAWFPYTVARVRTGLHEGVLLGAPSEPTLGWCLDMADAHGGDLFKLTRLAPDGLRGRDPADARSTGRWIVARRSKTLGEALPLAGSFEDMVARLGRHTRRNIRRSRRQAAAAGLRFEVGTKAAPASLRALARKTEPTPNSRRLLARLEAYAEATGRPFRTVVRAPDGRIVSYLCGFFGEAATAYLLFQLNDSAWNELGPSLLHRSYLMEWLIETGCEELVFVHGCSGILSHACTQTMLDEFWVMRRTLSAYLRTGAIAALRPNSSLGRLARLALGDAFGTLARYGRAVLAV